MYFLQDKKKNKAVVPLKEVYYPSKEFKESSQGDINIITEYVFMQKKMLCLFYFRFLCDNLLLFLFYSTESQFESEAESMYFRDISENIEFLRLVFFSH